MDYELWLDENGLKDTPAAKQAYVADLRLEAASGPWARIQHRPRGVTGLMYAVIVIDRNHDEAEAFGPYRTIEKCQEIRDLLRNPSAVDYRDPEEFKITFGKLGKYGEV